MANAVAYKNIGVAVETTYGSSIAGATYYVPVKSVELNNDPNFQIKQDTSTSVRGYDRSAYLRDLLEGSVAYNLDPISARFWLRLGMGAGVTVGDVKPGGGATGMMFDQNTDGTLTSYRLDVDKNTATKAYKGVAASSWELTSSGDFVEGTVNVTGTNEFTATTITPTGVTINPFVFAESALYYGATPTGCTTQVYVDEWTVTYDMQSEQAHQSGSRTAKRVDPKIPMLTGSWTRFYEDTNLETFKDDETEKNLLLRITGSQTYSGTSPYMCEIYIPRVRFKITNTNYEAGEFIKEECEWEAMYDSNIGYMMRPILYNGLASF